MYSTLQFHRSVRESGVSFEKIGYSYDGQHVMTVDPSSQRYWDGGKHSKALHNTGVFFGPSKKAIFICYLERLNAFLTVVSHKNAKQNQSLELCTWGHNMMKLKESFIGNHTYSVACVDPDQKYLILCGENLLVLNIVKPARQYQPEDGLQADRPPMNDETEEHITAPATTLSRGLDVSEYQTLSVEDMRGVNLAKMKTIDFLTPSIVAMASSTDLCILVRLPPAPLPPEPGSRAPSRRLRTPTADEVTPEMRGPHPFRCVRFENSSFIEREHCAVVAMKSCFREHGVYFIVGYSDGQIYVFCSLALAETALGLTKYDPKVNVESVAIITTPQFVCSFQAYPDPSGDQSNTTTAVRDGTGAQPKNPSSVLHSMGLRVSDGISLLSDTFSFELFTMNRRGLVCHWGVSALAAEVNCALLGSYAMGINRQQEFINADSTKQALFPGSEGTRKGLIKNSDRPELLIILPCSSDRPHRNVICSLSGQMCFLSVVQPQILLTQKPQLPKNPLTLIGACVGAEESAPAFRSTHMLMSGDFSVERRGSELLALEKEGNTISAISVVDGTPLSGYSVQCPSDFVDSSEMLRRVIPPKDSTVGKHCPIAYNNSLIETNRAQDTTMSCAVYSTLCHCTVVGYQSGAICAFMPKNAVNTSLNTVIEKYSVFRFNTKEVHGCPVRVLRVVPRNDNGADYLISGDASGQLAVWRLAIGVTKSTENCLWRSNAHIGSIIGIQLVTMPCRSEESKKFEEQGNASGPPIKFFDHQLIVTACSGGVIKGWKLVDPGALNIIGTLRTGGKPLLTSILAIGFLRDPEEVTPSPISPTPTRPGPPLSKEERRAQKKETPEEAAEREKNNRPALYAYEKGEGGKQEWTVPVAITAGVDFNLVLICGRANGLVDTWVMSNEQGMNSRDLCPVSVNQLHKTSVVAICQIPSLIQTPADQSINEYIICEGVHCNVISTSKDGWQSILKADFIGGLSVVNQISVGSSSFGSNSSVKDVILMPVSIDTGQRYVDCLIVREEGISKYLLYSRCIPGCWDSVFNTYRQLHGAGKLTRRREYTLRPNESRPSGGSGGLGDNQSLVRSMLLDSDSGSGLVSQSSLPVCIPSHVLPMTDTPDDSRPVTGEAAERYSNGYTHDSSSSRKDSFVSDTGTDHDLQHLDSLLPIPELKQDYTPDGSMLVASPADSRMDTFSPTGVLQHSSVAEMSQMRFGSPTHKRTEKEKEMINELQHAKKNGKLNEIFRQNCVKKLNCESIVPLDLAMDIITQYTGSARSDVVNLGLLVGIDDTEGLDYLKVCKLVAILSYAHKKFGEATGNSVGGKTKVGNRLKKNFKNMQKTKTIVTYNAIGERVVHKEKVVDLGYLADGVYKGFFSDIQKIWNQQPARVECLREASMEGSMQSSLVGESFPVYLSGIPSSFKDLLNRRYTTVPVVWTSDLPHWFDVGRTVRIARTILDSRLMLQRDHLFSIELSGKNILGEYAVKPKLPSLEQLTVQYFERNYGGAELNVSHSKVMHFMEACFQYAKFPVLESLRKFICPVETKFPLKDTYVWFYVEARDYLYSSNCVFRSDNALTLESGGAIAESLSVDSASSLCNVFWERIKRRDARLCGAEMFKKRGCFGPSVLVAMHELITALPTSNTEIEEDDEEEDTIDLEYFLDVMMTFLVQEVTNLQTAKDAVLSPAILPRKTMSASMQLEKSHKPMTNEKLSEILNNLRQLCLSFMVADPARSGIVTLSHFESTIKKEGVLRLGIDNARHSIGLLNSCKSQFTDKATNGVGYVDFIAVMVACVIQKHNAPKIEIEDFIEASNTVTRGIEENQVEALLHFLGHEQCPYPGDNPLWTLSMNNIAALANRRTNTPPSETSRGLTEDATSTTGESGEGYSWKSGSMSMSTEGQWHPGTRAASDNPGLISVNRIDPTVVDGAIGERSLGVDGAAWKTDTNNMKLRNEPSVRNSGNYIHTTTRVKSSIHGEVLSIKPPKGQALITPYDMASSLSASELQTLQQQLELCAMSRVKSAPAIGLSSVGGDGSVYEDSGSIDNVSKPGASATDNNTPHSAGRVKMIRIPEVHPGSSHTSPDRHQQHHHRSTSSIHEIMGTNTVFTELEGVTLSPIGSLDDHSSCGRQSLAVGSIGGRKGSQQGRTHLIRRPIDEKESDSIEGRYSVQGRATGPILPATTEQQEQQDAEQDIEFIQEEYRLSDYRSSKVHKIIAAREAAKKNKGENLAHMYSLCDSSTDSTLSVNGINSLSQWKDISIHDMTIHRQDMINEEQMAALEMKAERDKFYRELHAKESELMQAKRDARRKERESNKLAAEQMAIKDERKSKRLQEEARLAAEEMADLLAREQEEKLRIAAERQRRADQAVATRAAEAEMLERRKESDNLMALRLEDKRSRAVEDQIKEKERLALEAALAAEAAEKRLAMKAFAAEQERQEKLIAQEANKQKMLDMKAEMESIKVMMKEDVNVHKVYAEAAAMLLQKENQAEELRLKAEKLEKEKEEEARLRSANRRKPPVSDTVAGDLGDGEIEESLVSKRIKKFLRIMERTEDGTNLHPRRYDTDKNGRNFFMPMMFGNDISFNPFSAPNYDAGWFQQQLLEDRALRQSSGDGVDSTSDFSDITKNVARIKLQQALDQTKMYSVTDAGEDPESVTTVIRHGAIDWNEYMARDKYIVEESKGVGTTYTEYESQRTLNPLEEEAQSEQKRPLYRPVNGVTSSKLGVFYRNGNIGVTQLPMGHVVHDKIGKNCYRYYQVTHPSKSSILTVDLKCNKGQATVLLLWSPDKLPSIAACDEKADCNDLNGYCCRIAATLPHVAPRSTSKIPPATLLPKPCMTEASLIGLPPPEQKVYRPIIAVYSPDEASEFTLWAVASTDAKLLPKPIERVTRLIEEFNELTKHDSDKLSDHFSVYRRDARRTIDEEAAIRAESRQEIQNKIARSVLQPLATEPGSRKPSVVSKSQEREISEELATMEKFIARAGRLAIGNALRTTILAPSSPTKSNRSKPDPALDKSTPIHELVPIDESDDEKEEEATVPTDGTPARVVEDAFRGELDSFPMLYTRPTIAKNATTPFNIPTPVIGNKKRSIRKELMHSPAPIAYQLKNSKSVGFLKGSSKQDTFV